MEKKQIRNFKIKYPLNWTFGISITKLREDLDAIEKLGATRVDIEHGTEYDCSYVEINAVAERMETDDEYRVRIDKECKG